MTSSERARIEHTLLTARMWTRRTLTAVERQADQDELNTQLLSAWAALEAAMIALSDSERGFLRTRMFEREIGQRHAGL